MPAGLGAEGLQIEQESAWVENVVTASLQGLLENGVDGVAGEGVDRVGVFIDELGMVLSEGLPEGGASVGDEDELFVGGEVVAGGGEF